VHVQLGPIDVTNCPVDMLPPRGRIVPFTMLGTFDPMPDAPVELIVRTGTAPVPGRIYATNRSRGLAYVEPDQPLTT
jgi:hypothetical protein